MRFPVYMRRDMWYHFRVPTKIVAFYASLGTSETWKISRVCRTKSGMYPDGCIFFRGSHRAFPGPQTKHGRRLRPLSFAVIETRAEGILVEGRSEKLAQDDRWVRMVDTKLTDGSEW
jgi:hypothetical protein